MIAGNEKTAKAAKDAAKQAVDFTESAETADFAESAENGEPAEGTGTGEPAGVAETVETGGAAETGESAQSAEQRSTGPTEVAGQSVIDQSLNAQSFTGQSGAQQEQVPLVRDIVVETERAAQEAAIIAARQAVNIDREAIINQRLPLIARIYGVLVLLQGLITLPIVILWSVYSVRQIIEGHVAVDALSLTFVLSCLQVVVASANAISLTIFGVLLLRNHRTYAARWSYVLMAVTLAEGMLELALDGLGLNLLTPAIQMVILVALSITLDPTLREERRLQRELKYLGERDDYEEALARGMLGRDPSGKGYIALDFFNLFWIFVIGCVVGLTIETVYHWVYFHEFQDRAGLLWGPFSPIYGFGAGFMTILLNRLWRSNWLLIFCSSAVIGGVFEYFTSWFMEVAFGIKAWDYTGQWLSIDGRTSGKYMFFWGILGLAWIKFVLPNLLWVINLIPWKVRYSLTAVVFVLLFIDGVMTLMAFDCWYGRVAGRAPDSPITQFFADHFDNAFMEQRFQTMTIDPSKAGRL